jgi:hypothetical protein
MQLKKKEDLRNELKQKKIDIKTIRDKIKRKKT